MQKSCTAFVHYVYDTIELIISIRMNKKKYFLRSSLTSLTNSMEECVWLTPMHDIPTCFFQCNDSPAEMFHISWVRDEMPRLIYIIYWINLRLFSYIKYSWYFLNHKSKNMFRLKRKKSLKIQRGDLATN